MDRTRLQFDFNLQRISIISFATRLWDIPVIKKQIRDYCSKGYWYLLHNGWSDISENVLQYLDLLGLPTCILIQLRRITFFIGQKIHDWIEYVINVLQLDFIFTENIHWTSYGTVDEIKTFDLYWRKIMNDANFKTDSKFFRPELSPLYSLACIFCHKEFISDHEVEMIDDIGIFYHRPTVDEIYNIMSTSILLTLKMDVTHYIEEPEELFKLCIKFGFCNAAKFYIETLNDINKVLKVLVKACVSNHRKAFIREKCLDVLIFAIDKMMEEENAVSLEKFGKKIIKAIMFFWPYKELAVLLDYDWEIELPKLRRLLNFVVDSQRRYGGDFEYFLDNRLHFQILENVWEKMPVAEKVCFVEENGALLFSNFDIDFLNLILTDAAIQKSETGILENATKIGCRVLAESGKFEMIDKFIENVLNSNPKPKENLKEDHSSIMDFFLKNNHFDRADRFLDWISDSEEERVKFKNSVNIVPTVISLTEVCFNFMLADEVLKWKFETDAEIKHFKEGMKSHNFIRAGKENRHTQFGAGLEIGETYGEYFKIKSGNLNDLKPGDVVAMKTDDFENRDSGAGFSFYKYDPAREIMTGDILGIKSNDCAAREEIQSRHSREEIRLRYETEPRSRRKYDITKVLVYYETELYKVNFVGTKPGDYILGNVYKFFGKYEISPSIAEKLKRSAVAYCFIKFYYETDEEVEQFKKNAFNDVHSENLAGNLYENFFKFSSSDRFQRYNVEDRFFSFFNMSSDVDAFKIQLKSNIEKIMDVYLVDRCNVRLADFYFQWLFIGKFKRNRERLEAIEKFVNFSDRATLLCISYLRTLEGCVRNENLAKELDISPFNNKIFNYLSLIGDVKKFKNDSRVLNENPPDWFFPRLEQYRYRRH